MKRSLFIKALLALFVFSFFLLSLQSQELTRVKHFGKNKGHLKMFVHTPPNVDKTKPLPMVVVLHGCLQCASSVASQSGWNQLADQYGFYVLYPQQRGINNPERCYKWYRRRHINKNRGENFSILQMIDYMKSNYSIDNKQVFITGLSAGAAMSVVMMADYPEVFNSGAIFAGAPYRVATSMIPAAMAFVGWRVKSPEKWGKYVRKQNPFYNGEYPKMIIYQGNNDHIVNKRNGRELMKQWTSIHHIGTQPTETITHFLDNADIERSVYKNNDNKDVVTYYKIDHMGHALLVDPGRCINEGGRRGPFSKDKNYFSTLWTAYDFGLIPAPVIIGKTLVKKQEQLVFSVPLNEKARYEWTYPSDCKGIVNEKTNAITLIWGSSSGCINVTEWDSDNCKKQYKTLFVSVESN